MQYFTAEEGIAVEMISEHLELRLWRFRKWSRVPEGREEQEPNDEAKGSEPKQQKPEVPLT